MATEETVERFKQLKKATNEWADREKKRLEDQASFLRSINGTAEKISTQTTVKEKAK